MKGTALAFTDAFDAFVDKYGLGHNEHIYYIEHGSMADFPKPLYGLKQLGDVKPGQPGIICVRQHCLEALRKITKANPGLNYE